MLGKKTPGRGTGSSRRSAAACTNPCRCGTCGASGCPGRGPDHRRPARRSGGRRRCLLRTALRGAHPARKGRRRLADSVPVEKCCPHLGKKIEDVEETPNTRPELQRNVAPMSLLFVSFCKITRRMEVSDKKYCGPPAQTARKYDIGTAAPRAATEGPARHSGFAPARRSSPAASESSPRVWEAGREHQWLRDKKQRAVEDAADLAG